MTVTEIKNELRSRLNEKRFNHSLGVADTAVNLAEKFGVDKNKAYVAGLLHDCAREFEIEELIAQAERHQILVGEMEHKMPLLLHADLGAQIARETYKINDTEILEAIYNHTFGAKNMSTLDKIIYIADKIEPTRNYKNVDKIRALVTDHELNEILLVSFNESIFYVLQKNLPLHPKTVEARNSIIFDINRKRI